MNRETFAQYRDLKKEIDHLKRCIQRLSGTVSDSVEASNAEFPFQEIRVHIEGEDSTPYKWKLEKILRKRKAECARMTLEIESFIASIKDSRTRMVFERRYVDGWSWQKTSLSMGSADESYVRKMHERYIKH